MGYITIILEEYLIFDDDYIYKKTVDHRIVYSLYRDTFTNEMNESHGTQKYFVKLKIVIYKFDCTLCIMK